MKWRLLLCFPLVVAGFGAVDVRQMRAEPEAAERWPQKLLLAEGWWRGVVKLPSGPAEFLMEVRGTTVGDAEVIMHSEAATVRLSLLAQLDHDRELILYGNRVGESMEGRLRNGAWFGRYHVNAGGRGAGEEQVFSFWAEPKEPWEDVPPLRIWNLSGTWILSLGPGDTRQVHMAHFDHRLRGYWKEPGHGAIYMSGLLDGPHFRLEGWRSTAVLEGHYEAGGLMRGSYTDAQGVSQPFTMRRRLLSVSGAEVATLSP